MIVDNHTTNRAEIATTINWNALGCEIVFEAEDGKQALTYIKKHSVDLVITGIKMPIMDGLELITEIRLRRIECEIIVVSSCNGFNMVREIFKLGVKEYYLRSELSKTCFYEAVQKSCAKVNMSKASHMQKSEMTLVMKNSFQEDVLGLKEVNVEQYRGYYILIVQLDKIDQLKIRFLNIKRDLILSILEVLENIDMVRQKCQITTYSDSKILIYCNDTNEINEITRLSNHIVAMIQKYLNIDVKIGISDYGLNGNQLQECVDQATKNVALRYIYGEKNVFTMEMNQSFCLMKVLQANSEFKGIISSLQTKDDSKLSREQLKVFHGKWYEDITAARKRVLHMILIESLFLEDIGDSIFNIFPQNTNYEVKLNRLTTIQEIIMWSTNFNRWIIDYLDKRYYERKDNHFIQSVKRYVEDNYSNGNLTLGEVASTTNLNEQYFCAKFHKECGISFVEYLNNVRVENAKHLIVGTNIKMYKVGEAVGYNSIEHFSRVFRKKTGKTPKEYQKANKKIYVTTIQ